MRRASVSPGRSMPQHGAIGGRGGEADGGAVGADQREQPLRARLFEQHGGGADPQREQHDGTEAEREGDRGRAGEHVVGAARST